MNRNALLVAASIGAAAFAVGCQSSGHAEASTDVNRPTMTATADVSAMTVPYTVNADTSYMRTSTDTTAAGTLRSGDVVYLRPDAPTSGTVAAKTSDGRVVYVRASDLRRQ